MITLDSIISDYSFSETEREEAFEMVARILELAADKMRDDSPGATATIRRFADVSHAISDYQTFLEEYLEAA